MSKVDEAVQKIGNRFSTAVVAARRARSIRSYYVNLGQGIGADIPPQVADFHANPLSMAFQEIAEGKTVLAVSPPPDDDSFLPGDESGTGNGHTDRVGILGRL